MRILLDTQVFIWWDSQPHRLSRAALALCEDTSNQLMLSLASIWEMQIKHQIGKLTFHRPLPELIASQQEGNALRLLPIRLEHIFALSALPDHHRDPFDRLLIAQARVEQMPVLTADPVFRQYPIDIRE